MMDGSPLGAEVCSPRYYVLTLITFPLSDIP